MQPLGHYKYIQTSLIIPLSASALRESVKRAREAGQELSLPTYIASGVDLYSFALEAILLSVLTYIGHCSDLYRCVHPPAASDATSNASSQDSHEDCGQVLALSKIIATFAEQKDILLPARLKRAYSSAGLEHLPYKQGVIGSNPIGPTPQKSASREVRPQSNIHLGPIAQLV